MFRTIKTEKEDLYKKYPVEWISVRGYKAVTKDLHSFNNNYVYSLDEPNNYKGDLVLGKSGLHFCRDLTNLKLYSDILEARIFEVIAIVNKNYEKREGKRTRGNKK